MKNMNLIEIPIENIVPSKTNPRKEFPEEYIAELAASIRHRGIFNPLLVRRCEPLGPEGIEFELIAGECRLRGAKSASLATVPAIVRDDLSDEDVLELQLMENLQRKDLTVLDEADGLSALLDMRSGDGRPRWTIESLAEKLGKTRNYVRQRVRLRRLPPSGRQAVADGSLSFSVARLICRIPSEAQRAIALTEVLKPQFEDEPLTKRKAEVHIRQHFMADLKGAPWKLTDAELIPSQVDAQGARCFGGACSDCPFLAGNDPEDFADIVSGGRASSVCTHPECFNAKRDASWEEERMAALKAGKKVLSEEEGSKILDPHGSGLRWDAPYVVLNEQVPSQELRGNFKKPPTWKKLIADSPAAPEIIVVRDRRGRPLELVDRRQAVAAVKLAAAARGEEPAIKTGRGSDLDDAAAAANKSRLRERQKFCRQVAFESMHALRAAIHKQGLVAGFWTNMLDLGFDFAAADGLWLMCKCLDVEPAIEKNYGGKDFESALRKSFKGAVDNDLVSIVVLLMLSRAMKWAASPAEHTGVSNHEGVSSEFEAFAKIYGIDLEEIRSRVKSDLAENGKKPKLSIESAAAEFKKQADAGVKSARKSAEIKLRVAPAQVAAKQKKGKSLSGVSKKIMDILTPAGPEGMPLKDISEKVNMLPVKVSVWFSTTGRNLTKKLSPGVYAAL